MAKIIGSGENSRLKKLMARVFAMILGKSIPVNNSLKYSNPMNSDLKTDLPGTNLKIEYSQPQRGP